MILSLVEESGGNLVEEVWYRKLSIWDFRFSGLLGRGFLWLWVLFVFLLNSRMNENGIVKFMCWCFRVFVAVNPPRHRWFAYRVINVSTLLKEGLMCALQIPLASPK